MLRFLVSGTDCRFSLLSFYRALFTLLRWSLFLLLLGGTAVGVYLYLRINDEVRLRLLAEFQRKFPHVEITLGSAEILHAEQKIIARNLIFYEPARNDEPRNRILEIDEVVIRCPLSLEKYWNDEIEIESIDVNHPHFFLSRDDQGNLREKESFRFVKDQRKEFPISLLNGTVELDNLVVRDISATITPVFEEIGEDAEPEIPNFLEWDDPDAASDESTLPGKTSVVSLWKFEGTAGGNWFRRSQFEGVFDPETALWTIDGSLQQLYCNRELWAFLESWKKESASPRKTPQPFDLAEMIRSIRGESDFTFHLSRDETAPLGFRGNAEGSLLNGRVQIEFLKQPVSELGLLFHLSDEGIRINNCRGVYGDTEILFAYQQPNLSSLEGAAIRVKTGDSLIDKELIGRFGRFLPKNLGEFIDQFRQLSINANLETTWIRQNNRWVPDHFLLQGTDLSLQYAWSHYRIDGLAGKILLNRQGHLSLNFRTPQTASHPIPQFEAFNVPPATIENDYGIDGRGPALFPPNRSIQDLQQSETERTPSQAEEDRRFSISGEFDEFLTAPTGNIQVEASAIPINARLIDTIPEKQRRVVQSLHPEGSVDLSVNLGFGRDWAVQGVQKHFVIKAKNCSICYDNFPYPVRGIRGTIEWNGTDWTFRDFTGDNESTGVQADGYLRKNQDDYALSLHFVATDLPLEGRLREALKNPSYREIHQSIRGSGKLNVDAQILFFPTTKKLHVSFDAVPDKNQGITICPTHFPYRIENVHGLISFDNGVFTIKKLKGRNKDAKFSSDVYCEITPDGSWNMEINDLRVDQISAQDNDLLKAIPEHFRQFVKNLRVEGPLNFDGGIHFSKAYAGAPLVTKWNTSFTLFQNAANLGVPIRNIAGRIHLAGENDSLQTEIVGELELDSAFYGGVQFLNITGPFLYDGEQILFGQNVVMDRRQSSILDRVKYWGQSPDENRIAVNDVLTETPSFEQRMYGKTKRGRTKESSRETVDLFDPYRERLTNLEEANRIRTGMNSEMRPISASVFDGAAYCRGRILFGPKTASYNVQMDLIEAGLAPFVRDFRSAASPEKSGPLTRKNVSGLITASARISGEGKNTDTISGEGFITLRNAVLYETPTMIKLLQILSIQEPSDNAFSSSDVKFRIQGKKMLLNSVVFQGDAFSLEGSGDLQWDANRKINLILRPKLGNAKSRIPIIDLVGGAGEQFNAVHVEGPLSDPDVIRIPLPGVRNALEQIQGEM